MSLLVLTLSTLSPPGRQSETEFRNVLKEKNGHVTLESNCDTRFTPNTMTRIKAEKFRRLGVFRSDGSEVELLDLSATCRQESSGSWGPGPFLQIVQFDGTGKSPAPIPE